MEQIKIITFFACNVHALAVTRTSAAAENHAWLHITLKDMFYKRHKIGPLLRYIYIKYSLYSYFDIEQTLKV